MGFQRSYTETFFCVPGAKLTVRRKRNFWCALNANLCFYASGPKILILHSVHIFDREPRLNSCAVNQKSACVYGAPKSFSVKSHASCPFTAHRFDRDACYFAIFKNICVYGAPTFTHYGAKIPSASVRAPVNAKSVRPKRN